MAKTTDSLPPWPHYARPQLAQTYLEQSRQLGVRAFTIFAPRGWGKTAFLRNDLIPAAQAARYRVAYVDLWSVSDPAIAVAAALETPFSASEPTRATLAVERLLRSPLSTVKASLQVAGLKTEAEIKPARRDAQERTERLLRAFEAFIRRDKRPLMIIFDEAQTMAEDRHVDTVRALRSNLQRYEERIVRVFTGSSRAGLDRLFRRTRAPLFGQGGAGSDFPHLDDGFIDLIVRWVAARTRGFDLGREAARRALASLGYSARQFHEAVESVLVGRAANISIAAQMALATLRTNDELIARIARLNALQLATLRFVWEGGEGPFIAGSRTRIAALANLPDVSTAAIQAALKRLERAELIYRADTGRYVIESHDLALLIEQLDEASTARRR